MTEKLNDTEVKVNIVTFGLDDNPFELELMRLAFEKAGITDFQLFDNVEKFWFSYYDDVHVAVLDYDLKPQSGLDIAEKLLSKNPFCKIIIYSGIEDHKAIAKALNMGIYKWIGKNEINSLQRAIDCVVKAKQDVLPFVLFQKSINSK